MTNRSASSGGGLACSPDTLRRAKTAHPWLKTVICVGMMLLAYARTHAYIDPGIVGALYQAVYALVFGAITAWVFRPWRYLMSLFRRRRPVQSPGSRDERRED